MKVVKLYRVTMKHSGFVPKGYAEGQLIGFTDEEVRTLDKLKDGLRACFEEVTLILSNNQINEGVKDAADNEKYPDRSGTLEANRATVEGQTQRD